MTIDNWILGGLQIVVLLINVGIFAIIKFNDLAHLERYTKSLSQSFKENSKELKNQLKKGLSSIKADSDKKHKENKENIKELQEKISYLGQLYAAQEAICKERKDRLEFLENKFNK